MPAYRFGDYVLDTDAYVLRRGDDTLALTGKPLDVLAYLAARPGRLVTRSELFRQFWADTNVTENVLTRVVADARRALDDPAGKPVFVETVSRRGYRFVASVEMVDTVPAGAATPQPAGVRSVETSSLDVLRNIFDGQLKLESLSAADVDSAIARFMAAIELEPGFASGYVGLANAKFWKYESTRTRFHPDAALLAEAIQDARQAVHLAPSLDEAHATLSYVLAASARWDEARVEAQRALTLRPDFWAHHFRLGHTTWGADAISSLTRAIELYPSFVFAQFEIAIVHVARGSYDIARDVLREGIATRLRLSDGAHRFPANGLHWLLGAIALQQGDIDGALAACDAEIADAGEWLYALEFTAAAMNLAGFALLDAGDADGAAAQFRESLEMEAEQVRPHIGLAYVARAQGRDASDALAEARHGIEELQCGGRTLEAITMTAAVKVAEQDEDGALQCLARLVEAPAPWAGWNIDVDPLFAPLRGRAEFRRLVDAVGRRAA